jgi:signal transduction histidine kinase
MAATARRIESTNLDERLRQSQDELGELASTFNQLLDRLQAAFQRERRFIADVSHDLRTPLALAKSTIGVALNRPRRADELREVLGDVDVQIDRVTSLLEATLFLSRADSEQMEQGFEPVDLTELLADLHETTALYAQTEHDQTVTSFVAPNLCVRGDRDQLTRLFLNLLDNAMQYTPAGGTIRLNAAAAGAVAQISLQDNGVGIAPEDLGHVFDRFFRADAARASTNGHHHGLGLSIAQAIASAHKGKISVASTLGKGTTFTVELPLGTGCPAGRPSSTAGARATSSNQVVQQPDAIA